MRLGRFSYVYRIYRMHLSTLLMCADEIVIKIIEDIEIDAFSLELKLSMLMIFAKRMHYYHVDRLVQVLLKICIRSD